MEVTAIFVMVPLPETTVMEAVTEENPWAEAEISVVPAAVVVVTLVIVNPEPTGMVTELLTLATASLEEARVIVTGVIVIAGEPEDVNSATTSALYEFPDAGNTGGIGVSFMAAGLKLPLSAMAPWSGMTVYGTRNPRTSMITNAFDRFIFWVSGVLYLNAHPSTSRRPPTHATVK
jgi:hypothetical protein